MLANWLSDKIEWAPLPLRVSLGIIFFAHGAQKVLGWKPGVGIDQGLQLTIDYFRKLAAA